MNKANIITERDLLLNNKKIMYKHRSGEKTASLSTLITHSKNNYNQIKIDIIMFSSCANTDILILYSPDLIQNDLDGS